jgi:hypothetical protein
VIGAESDTFESVKRREFVPFALAACLAAAVLNYESHRHRRSCRNRRECVRIGRHADDRLDTRQSAPLGIHQRYEADDVFDATIDAGDVFPVREGGTVAHLTGKHVADRGLGGFDQNIVAKETTARSLMDLGRGEAFIRTLNTRGAPINEHYIETSRAELPTGRFEANVRMTRSKFARRREDVERNTKL